MAKASTAGSVYHLSSLRYAEGSTSIGVPRVAASSTSRSRLEELFEHAEDDYRPGQSSSSSLLIRSNVLSMDAPSEEHSEAKDGFLRTKARATLAQSIPKGEEDALLGVHISEVGSSIYLRNRRAKDPLTRASYAEIRAKKRQAKERAKLKARSVEEGLNTPVDDEEIEERELQKSKAERITMEMQVDSESVVPLMPSGSLMETIHYLAAHYYDARGLLRSRDGTAPKKLAGANLNRVGDGSALVALAVYLEEVAKYESAGQPDQETQQQESNASAQQAAQQLARLQEEQRKKRRRKVSKPGKVTKRLYANGWARQRRRKRAKTAAALDSDASGTEAEDEDEDEEEEDGDEDEEEEDGDEDEEVGSEEVNESGSDEDG